MQEAVELLARAKENGGGLELHDLFGPAAESLADLGSPRFMAPRAEIGFHAAFELVEGVAVERGAANALVGAYLSQLGLPQRAIFYVTSAPPTSMRWPTPETLGAKPPIASKEPESLEQAKSAAAEHLRRVFKATR